VRGGPLLRAGQAGGTLRLGHSDRWEFLIGLEGRASNRDGRGAEPQRRLAPIQGRRKCNAIARKAYRAYSAGPAADGGVSRRFAKRLALPRTQLALGARATVMLTLADRLLMFLLGAILFQLVEIIRTWP